MILFYSVNICHLNWFNKKLTGREYRQDNQTKSAGMKKEGARGDACRGSREYKNNEITSHEPHGRG